MVERSRCQFDGSAVLAFGMQLGEVATQAARHLVSVRQTPGLGLL